MAQATAVWRIVELQRTGQGVLVERDDGAVFEWTGPNHAAPQATVEIPMRINTVREVYPGTEQPVEQVLSSELPPFSMRGEWNDKFGGAGFAAAQEAAFRAMCGRGSLVRLEFEQFRFVGLFQGYTRGLVHNTRITYEVTFSPHFEEGRGATAREGRLTQATPRANRQIAQQTSEDVDNLADAVAEADSLVLGDTSKVDVQAAVAAAAAQQEDINAAAVTGIQDNAVDDLRNQRDRYRQQQTNAGGLAVQYVGFRDGGVLAFRSAGTVLAFESYSRGTRVTARSLLVSSNDGAIELDARIATLPRLIERPPDGESVYTVAGRHFSSPEDWRLVAEVAGVSELAFDGEAEFVIPEAR